jgi:hypothetical protein
MPMAAHRSQVAKTFGSSSNPPPTGDDFLIKTTIEICLLLSLFFPIISSTNYLSETTLMANIDD